VTAAPLDHGSAEDLAILDRREQAAAAQRATPLLRARYVAAHAALRRHLAAALGIAPQEVVIDRLPCHRCGAPHGKPAMRARPHLSFNLSRSHNLALIAIGHTVRVGVDLEVLATAPRVEGIGRRFLADAERSALSRLPQPVRRATCLAQWTRKEAWLKCTGDGLTRDPRRAMFDVVPPVHLQCRSVRHGGMDASLYDLVPAGAIGALVTQPPPQRLFVDVSAATHLSRGQLWEGPGLIFGRELPLLSGRCRALCMPCGETGSSDSSLSIRSRGGH